MSKKIWRLTVRDEISAGHALRHYEGKCERLHGHNFAVELTVEGDKLTENVELLLDFKVLKRALKEELAALDHQIINEVPPFDRLNPSSENISRHIFQNVARRLAADESACHVRVHSVSVSEKARRPPPICNWTTSFAGPAVVAGPVMAGVARVPLEKGGPSSRKLFFRSRWTVPAAAVRGERSLPRRSYVRRNARDVPRYRQGDSADEQGFSFLCPALSPPFPADVMRLSAPYFFCHSTQKAP